MLQQVFAQDAYFQSTKSTRKRVFLTEMDAAVPWSELLEVIEPHMAKGGKTKGGRPPIAASMMLRIHFMQQWFCLSDPAMEEALLDTPLFREFAGLRLGEHAMPDESTILRFRHMLEEHKLAEGIFAAVRQMLEQRGLLLKGGSIVDATSGNVADVVKANELLHGEETRASADAGYTGVQKREDANPKVQLRVAMKRAKRKALDKAEGTLGSLYDKLETIKSKIRAKVEHPFRVLRCQFGYRKVRYKGLKKNEQQLNTPFALTNLWQASHAILNLQAQVRPA